MSYCDYIKNHPEDELNRRYHDEQYGFPLHADNDLFERLALEINQAGLSWTLILKRRELLRSAFDGFDLEVVAACGAQDMARLLADPGVIRNRRKIEAVIENARRIQSLCAEAGSFEAWLDAHHPRPLEEWARLFKQTFVFTGREIVGEFLISTGYLPGAHDATCPIYTRIARLNPAWLRK
ncbi:MAG: DNA-3-methyladenine glycosylase I [Anaerolineales bacterium]|jgi:DNA-3-methyladenine glycosylase I